MATVLVDMRVNFYGQKILKLEVLYVIETFKF